MVHVVHVRNIVKPNFCSQRLQLSISIMTEVEGLGSRLLAKLTSIHRPRVSHISETLVHVHANIFLIAILRFLNICFTNLFIHGVHADVIAHH